MTKQRLSKVLAAAGIASRRHAEEIIFSGRVRVNGSIEIVPQTPVDPTLDKITIDGKRLGQQPKKIYYMLNKPVGYICTSAPNIARRVIDLFDEKDGRLFTIGRLDKDTDGLLLVTNDGHFANSVIHPRHNVEKEYLAKVDKEIEHPHLVLLSKGTPIEGRWVRPIKLAKVRRGTIKVTVTDGKKREVRIMLERAGFEVLSLTRIRIGGLTLGNLPVGHYRKLTEGEMKLVQQSHENKKTGTTAAS
jgi:23S rRNA pseudouridine2605 synthase